MKSLLEPHATCWYVGMLQKLTWQRHLTLLVVHYNLDAFCQHFGWNELDKHFMVEPEMVSARALILLASRPESVEIAVREMRPEVLAVIVSQEVLEAVVLKGTELKGTELKGET